MLMIVRLATRSKTGCVTSSAIRDRFRRWVSAGRRPSLLLHGHDLLDGPTARGDGLVGRVERRVVVAFLVKHDDQLGARLRLAPSGTETSALWPALIGACPMTAPGSVPVKSVRWTTR